MRYTFIIIFLFIASVGFAQIQNLKGLDVQSGKEVKLSDYSGKKGIAIIFTSNVCPYSVYYEGRITQLISEYGDNVQFILVNSHTDDKESAEEMKNKISTWGLNVPYISDKNGDFKSALDARKSPEVYLIKSVGKGLSVYYKGSIDNNPQVASDVKEQYLRENIELLMTGKPAKTSGTRPIGCMIK